MITTASNLPPNDHSDNYAFEELTFRAKALAEALNKVRAYNASSPATSFQAQAEALLFSAPAEAPRTALAPSEQPKSFGRLAPGRTPVEDTGERRRISDAALGSRSYPGGGR